MLSESARAQSTRLNPGMCQAHAPVRAEPVWVVRAQCSVSAVRGVLFGSGANVAEVGPHEGVISSGDTHRAQAAKCGGQHRPENGREAAFCFDEDGRDSQPILG